MNKQKFIRYLRDPNSLDSESLKSIEALLTDRPYFQGAHTLLAKGSKLLEAKDAAKHISTAAVYSTDRILLKKFINDQLFFLDPLEVHESHEADLEKDIEKALKSNKIATTKVKTVVKEPSSKKEEKANASPTVSKKNAPKESATSQKQPDKEHSLPIPTSDGSSLDSLIDEIYRDLEELKTNRSKLREIEEHLAEEEAVDEAVKRATAKSPEENTKQSKKGDDSTTLSTSSTKSETSSENQPDSLKSRSSISKKSDQPSTAQPSTPEKGEPVKKIAQSRSARVSTATPIDSENVAKSTQKVATKKTEDKKTPVKKTAAKKKATTKKSTSKAIAEEKEAKPVVKNITSKKKEVAKLKVSETKDQSEDTKEAAKDKVEKTKSEVVGETSQDKIISEFIRVNPSIPKPKKGTSSKKQEDLSTESTQLHPDVASEYLAEIYTEQGRIERACQIYEALMIRFPEKSLYFADIVQKLNERS